MTTDLWMLVWTALLALGLPFIYLAGLTQAPGGTAWSLGNRAEPVCGELLMPGKPAIRHPRLLLMEVAGLPGPLFGPTATAAGPKPLVVVHLIFERVASGL